jgi:hypothetical protein
MISDQTRIENLRGKPRRVRPQPIQTSRRDFLGISLKGILLASVPILGFPLPASANAPKEVRLAYDRAARMLTVQITHPSSSPGFHYIDKVEIKKGGKAVSSTEYNSQPDKETFSYTYPLEASPGDILEVKVGCNIWGSKTEKLTVTAS